MLTTRYPNFLNHIEQRPGVRFVDPLLHRIEPLDASWVTFIILYLSVFQHVHYTCDVFVAPFVAYASVRLVSNAHQALGKAR